MAQRGENLNVLERPAKNPKNLLQMENRIVENARPGKVLNAPYQLFENRHKELGCGRIADQLYVTQTKPSAANALLRQAEHMGSSILGWLPKLPTLWDPIITTMRADGFG